MAYEQRNNSGSLFKHTKEKDSQPDYKGEAMINGQLMWMSAWLKTSPTTGTKYMSFSFQPKEQQGQATARQAPARQAPAPAATFDADFDSDLPF